MQQMEDRENDIAVVGMSCRFPGARDTAEFWRNLCGGVESIARFTQDALLQAGFPPELVADPAFVGAHGALDDAYAFDAPFFGVSGRDAQAMDPQHRVFMECVVSALEDAGVDPARYAGSIGVYAGSGFSTHLARVLDSELVVPRELAIWSNDKDFLTTRVSYKLGLRGPSVVVQTACSTSLVAIHLACQSLLNRECDVALAGGVTICPDQVTGYSYQEGGIYSPDGKCRSFDASAAGVVAASGAGVVTLKRFADAVRDGDTIHAVVKGSAINNDGSEKIGFTAPSVQGQAKAIAEAVALAGVDPAEIGYVETHGTGTPLGDPIEIAALREVFGAGAGKATCALGAVKPNLGHLDTAAGVAGFIKTVLALKHRTLPPTLHFQAANPETGLDDSPFYVNAELRPWASDTPRRAGVSSFGIGGTNAHVVLEEAPELPRPASPDAAQLLVLSARSEDALERMRANLAAHLAENADLPMADVAFTLQEGRAAHAFRWSAVATDADGARAALTARGKARKAAPAAPSVAFLFPGQGTQYPGMARELYEREPVYRAEMDRCATLLAPALGVDLRTALFPAAGAEAEAAALLQETRLTQPALFATEYATAKLWMSRGVKPESMLGHSIGEYVAACLAGVFTLESALKLVAARGALMQSLPAGAMLAVPMPERDVAPLLPAGVSLAAVNSTAHCVVSGEFAEIDAVEALLSGRDVAARRLHTSHAFHSAAMDPILDAFAAEVRAARPAAPAIPFLSNVTGDWITAEQATDAKYWVRHLRETVRFADGVARLLEDAGRVLLEVGPGETLGTFARRSGGDAGRVIVRSLPRAGAEPPMAADAAMLEAAGQLWAAGVELDWAALRGGAEGRRVPLPAYPFDRTVYRAQPRPPSASSAVPAVEVPTPTPSRSDAPHHPELMQPPVLTETIQAPGRQSRITAHLTEVFARLLAMEPAQIDADAGFLELGADSLLLMQLSRTVETAFGVRVPFRRLLTELSSIGELAAHLDGAVAADFQLPGEEPAAPEPVQAVVEAPVQAAAPVVIAPVAPQAMVQVPHIFAAPAQPAADGGALQGIFAQQLAIMQSQLAMLSGAAAPAAPVVTVPANGTNGHGANGNGSNGSNGNGSNGKNGHHPENGAATANGKNGHAAPTPRLERVQAALVTADTEKAPASHGPHRPVSATKGLGGAFDARQKAHFEALVQRYTQRTRGSREYAAGHRPHLSDNRMALGFRQSTKELMYPIVGERSQGTRLWDVDGNEYIDFTNGFGVHFFGHRPPFIVEAVEEQVRRGFHTGPQSDLAGPAAKLFSELTGMERVTFCNTGSEAVMTALRVARSVTGRDRVVIFESSYHGCFDGILARPGAGERPRPIAPGTPQGMVDDVVLLPYGTDEALEYLRAHAGELAAVMVEPIQSNNPEMHPRAFLHEVRAITEKSGTALIFDEMITGLRMGHRGAQGYYGVDADLGTYGKVIGGGMPVGVLAGKARFMDAIDGGQWSFGDDSYPTADQTFFAGTFCKHPATMAAAHAVLVHLKEQGQALYDTLHARTDRLVAALRKVLEEEGAPVGVISAHSSFRFVARQKDAFMDLLFYHMLERGIYIWESRTCFLSTVHTDEDCDAMVRALRESLQALRDGGFLPEKLGGGGTAVSVDTDGTTPTVATETRTFPLTPAQRQIWVHAQFGDEASRAYNEQFVVGVRGKLNADALRMATADLMAHHESLRTVFDAAGEVQHVLPTLDAAPFFAGETAPAAGTVQERLAEALSVVFDLATGPLFRVYLHDNGADGSVMQFVVHHVVADGMALDILKRDLETAYLARAAGETPRLLPAMQFSEYARLFTTHAETYADRETEWLAGFEGAQPTALPYDRPRAQFPTNHAGHTRWTLPLPLSTRMREMGRRQGFTPFMTLVSGLLATLHRVTGQDDLVLGISSAGRPFEGSDSLVGHCVEVLPIRSRAADGIGTQRFQKDVRGWLLDAYEHEVFTWGRLHEKRNAPRDPSAAPLIAVEINMEPVAVVGADNGATPRYAGMELQRVGGSASPFTRWDIHLDAMDTGEEFVLFSTFNSDLLDKSTVERMMAQVERVLEQMVEGDVPLGKLELLGADERGMLDEWNRTAAHYPADACVHRMFEAQAARTPGAVALVCEDEQFTYEALNAQANRLAHRLRALGVGPDVPVAMCFERGAEMIVGLLGVLKAGGAYVALDTALPAERLAYMLADSGAAALVTRTALRGKLPAGSVPVVCVDDAALADESAENPAGGAKAANLAYLVYTSGSTGQPKGVAVEHRQLANYLFGLRDRLGLDEGASYATVSTLSADLGNTVVFSALAWGGTLHVLGEKRIFSGDEVAEYFARHRIDCLKITPSHLSALQAGGDPRRVMPRRWLVLGGEASTLPWVDALAKAAPECAVFNHYGPTETTVGALTFRVGADRPDTQSQTLVLGRPLPNYQVFVVDGELRPVPVGVAGELLIGGAGVARGYLGRPELTAERFIRNPFGEGRLYRTGDRCRQLPDGNVEFLGRMDDQVKIRGFRVEPGEVAAALSAHPAVRDAAVVARDDDGTGELKLVAYVVGPEAEAVALRDALARSLPDYMVPSAFVMLPSLPLNANGKLDRAALPAPAVAAAAVKKFVGPRTPVEEVLAGIFCQVLKLDQVSVFDSFFDLGGHSLKATRVGARAKAILGVPLKPRDLFECETVAKLAARVEEIRSLETGIAPPVLPGPDDEKVVDTRVAPRTPVEEVLAGIFCQVLKLDEVSVFDSFFDLGGHSLKATRVGARAKAILGVPLKPRDLFECETVAKLAARVEEIRSLETGIAPPVLPGPGEEQVVDTYVAPRTPVEEVLAGIFADVLKIERVSVDDSFFALGGHSLKATRVGARAKAVFGVALKPRDLFECETVAKLAERVEAIRRKQLGLLPPVTPVERTGEMKLSFAQERLWFLDQMQPGGTVYSRPMALRLRGGVDERAMQRALAELVRRHEALRTVFVERNGAPVQVIQPAAAFSVPVTDLSAMDAAAREAEMDRLVAEEATRPFDLAAGPLFRAALLRLAADDHVLMVSLHHVVSDGWSLGVIFGEMAALYAAYREGRPSPLPELRVQYADYAAWQREHVAGEVLDKQLAWWKGRLEGAPALLELPTDHPRPAMPTHRGAQEQASFPAEVLAGLHALAKSEGATLYMVLVAAFQVMLAKYAGTDDVVVGSPIAGRTSDEVEGLIGFFVNTLALRTRMDGDPTFREVLKRVREMTLAAYDHQDLPFEKLVEAVQPERSMAHTPLFQVMFTMANATEGAGLELPGLTVEYLGQDTGSVKFDLTLHCGEVGDQLFAALAYSTELFEQGTAVRMLGHLGRVLEEVSRAADVKLSALELLGNAERARVVEEWNATGAQYPAELCVHQQFEAQAERTPGAVAVRAGDESLTYAELNARANRLAHYLVKLGVGPDVRVGICLERGVEMAVGVLAVLKAGGAYVPMDPAYPADRLRQMLDDSAPAALLTHAAADAVVEELVRGTEVPVVRFESDKGKWAKLSKANPARPGLSSEHLCYVIYTSGSTGRPKGVMNQHRTVVNRVTWGARAWEMSADDVLLCKTSLSFDGHVRELFLPWSLGATTVMARPDGHRDPEYLLDVIRAEGITTVNLVPSMLQVLLDNPQLDRAAGLARILCGGEALPGALLTRFLERLPGTALHNLYGPSEAATAMAALHCGAGQARAVVPIGRPVSNTRLYLLDPAGLPVPVGVAGELYVGGAGVARGYLDRPGQTAERFVPDSFANDGSRLYRTGDLGRWLADGSIEFLGRNDFQVKVRGFRIELGEVEARLDEAPGVREAVVMARRDAGGETRLVAWYTGTETTDAASLRAQMSERLPDYMVPSAFVRMEALPLTPNGKLDRRALPEPGGDAFVTRAWEAPAGETETAVAQIWADVLGVERVGRRDHFFELGGHSLRAVMVVSRVRQALGVQASLGELFVNPVLADFARGLKEQTGEVLPAIEPVSREGRLELSFAQQRLWFLDRMGTSDRAYNVPLGLRLKGSVDRDALGRTLDRIVARHETLRTVFALEDGEPVQRIRPAAESRFGLVDHDLSGEVDADAALRRMMADEANTAFDLETGPVVRGRLIRMADDDHVLLITLHHIASDGWSVDVLVNELSVLYAAFAAGRPDPLPELPVQYADYAAWQRRWLDRDVLQTQVDYWKRALAGAPELLELPTDRPRPAEQDYTGAVAGVRFDAELSASLKALSRRHGTTLFMTMLAGWAATLARLSGQTDVVVGTPSANRGQRETEGLIGFFVNTLALRVDLGGSPTVAQLLARVREQALAAQQHGDIPFDRVVELVQPVRSLSHGPLFQVAFAWQNTPGGTLELPGLTLSSVGSSSSISAKYDLSLTLQETDAGIMGDVTYPTALFDRATVERWMGYLRNVLAAMAADDGQPVDRLPLLPDAERVQVVETWNRPQSMDDAPAACVHTRFEAQAERRPDALAVVYDGERLSYAELNARANRLAHHLRGLGVGPDARVAISAERSPEMVVGLLAILKAGGAYVPLDPQYPAERLRGMLQDSAPAAVLARGALDATLSAVAAESGVPVVDLADASAWAHQPETNPALDGLTPDHLVYVIYTSGSTGRPKGTEVPHRAIPGFFEGVDYCRFDEQQVLLQHSSTSWDALTLELWPALLTGGACVLLPAQATEPALLGRQVREHGVTTLWLTAQYFNSIVDGTPHVLEGVRQVMIGGEAVSVPHVRRALELYPELRLVNGYGPSECTVFTTCWPVPAGSAEQPVPIGAPVGDRRVYVLDHAMNPVPVGVAGELYVGGPAVARGYLNRPALTADKFVPDPFSARAGARLYRSGDRVRWRADGLLEFVGRADAQVKIRGFRVEPGEVETVLAAYAGVREARVVVREDQPGDKRLVAYMVGDVDGESLRAHLKAALPEYMVPSALVVMERLPLTAHGKLDARALPAPELQQEEWVEPTTAVEQALAAMWAEVLRVERVGVNDDFFQLGGHSLLIMRLIARVQDAFGLELSIRTVFSAPTLGAMAGEIERKVYEDILGMSDAQAEQLAELTQNTEG